MAVAHTHLSVTVSHQPGYGKCKIASAITVKLGNLIVAEKTLGGQYNQAQAIREFQKNPHAFNKGPIFMAHTLPFAS